MSDAADRLWKVIEPYLAAEHVELDDIEVLGTAGASILRVTVDVAPTDGSDAVDGDETVGVDRIARISRGISRLLDEHDPIDGSYTLEVSSPGLERKLRRPRHYEKAIGREVRVKSRAPYNGNRVHRGVLTAADEDGFTVVVPITEGGGDGTAGVDGGDEGDERTFSYEDVASARTVFVWEKSKPGNRQ